MIDSWNNIKESMQMSKDAFFIFDEQRVIGSGNMGLKAFLKNRQGK